MRAREEPTEFEKIILRALHSRDGHALRHTHGEIADAIIAALSEAGLVIVPRETGDVVRQARCPSDGRHLVGECYDAKTCGCTIGLHLAALLAAKDTE